MAELTVKYVRKVFKEIGIKIYPDNPSLYGLIFIAKDKNKDYSIFDKKDMWFDEHRLGIVIGMYSSDGISFFSKGEKEGYGIKNEKDWTFFKSDTAFKDWCVKNVNRVKEYLKSLPTKTKAYADKVFAYHGQIITASSKEEAIQKIVAKTGDFKVGEKVTVSLKTLYKETKKHKTAFGYTIDTSEKGYYDLKDKFSDTVCMDGETCEVKTISGLGDLTLINRDGEKETTFTLSKKEADICIF